MSEFNAPAYPICHYNSDGVGKIDSGLTIRQMAVLMAMQGILAHPNAWNGNAEAAARHAIATADAVLKAERKSRK